ncbi:MAG: MBL fold metallo-hydrolase [Candidatus Aminicenantales bacterium]|jgi:cyclase
MKSPFPVVLAIISGILILRVGIAFAQQNPPSRQESAPVTIQPITLTLLLVKGGAGANSGLIIGYKEVFAIDAKMSPESVREMLAELKKTVSAPVTKIILTHSDGDHINGLPGFPKGLPIISQEQVKADMIKAAADLPALQDYLPTVVFKDELKLQSGRRTVTLRHYGPAHTSGDTVVYVDLERTAFVGDLVFIGRDPIVHRSKNGSSFGLVKTLKAILDHRPHIETFIPGHGDMVTRDEVEGLVRAIEIKQARVKTLIAEGKSLDEIKKILQVEDRPGAGGGPQFMSLVEVIYQELTEKKEKK